jgi:hypothetical protein
MAQKNGDSCLKQVITLSDLATLTVQSERSVQRLVKSGVLRLARDRQGRQLKGRFVLGDALPKICELLRDQASASDPHESAYSRARAQRMQCDAEMRRLELRARQGELIDGKIVDREVMGVLSSVKNHVLALPTRVTRLLAPYTGGGENTKIVHKIMTDAARSTLTEASNFKLSRKQLAKHYGASKHVNGDDDNGGDDDS